MKLNTEQNDAVNLIHSVYSKAKTLSTSALGVVTGGPGTGKTTVVKMALQGLKTSHVLSDIVLLAPTGKAALRLAEVTGRDAYTIHRALLGSSILDDATLVIITSVVMFLYDGPLATVAFLFVPLLVASVLAALPPEDLGGCR